MHKNVKLLFSLLIIAAIFFFAGRNAPTKPIPENPNYKTVSDGVLTMEYFSNKFGLAVSEEQLFVKVYIPPCEPGFKYCFYYMGNEYLGTNFESAGIAVRMRDDLMNAANPELSCLEAPPEGYTYLLSDKKGIRDSHSFSIFENIGDAAAGHYSLGSIYRLYVRQPESCYEFKTRVAQSQFFNYPEGTIREFSELDAERMKNRLDEIVNGFSLGDETNLFK